MAKTFRGIPLGKLFDWNTGNLGATALGLFYLVFPFLAGGFLNETMAIFGFMFLTVAIMRAKPANAIISGFCTSFIALSYLFAVAGLVPLEALWILSIVFFAVFLIMEFGFFKFGPTTQKADAFQMVTFMVLGFSLLIAFLGYGGIFNVDWANMMGVLNQLCIMVFAFASAAQIAGWQILKDKKSTNHLVVVVALVAIGVTFIGASGLMMWA